MASVSRSIRIDRPVEAVFEYLDDPRNHVEITPSLAEVSDIEPLDNGGKRVDHTYTMAGIGLDGTLEQRVHEENERMVFDLVGDLHGEISLSFEAVDGEQSVDGTGAAGEGGSHDATEVTYAAEYEVPGRVLSAVAEPFIERYNERELRTTLENLKTRLESEPSTPTGADTESG